MATNPAASKENFEELRRDEDLYEMSLDLLAYYLDTAFEDAAAGEVERWTVSCLPGSGDAAPLFSLAVGSTEVLRLDKPAGGADGSVTCLASVAVSRSALEDEAGTSLGAVKKALSAVRFLPDESDASDAVVVVVNLFDDSSLGAFEELSGSGRPIRRLADQLEGMESDDHHNTWLARAALDRIASAPADEAV